MKLAFFLLSVCALFLLYFMPAKITVTRIDDLSMIPSGSKVIVSGFIIGNKLCSFPKCIKLVSLVSKNGKAHGDEKPHGQAIVTGTFQKAWQKEVLIADEVELQ